MSNLLGYVLAYTCVSDGGVKEHGTHEFHPNTTFERAVKMAVELEHWEPTTLTNPLGRVVAVGRAELEELHAGHQAAKLANAAIRPSVVLATPTMEAMPESERTL